MSTIKRQHYVWRKYLRPWTEDEKIWTFFKEKNFVEKPGLMKIGQERYFYKLVEFTKEEKEFLNKFIEHSSHKSLIDLNKDYLKIFTYPFELKQQLVKKGIDKEKIEKSFREIEINTMEKAHSFIEGFGKKIIDCRNVSDLNFLDNEDNLFETIMFLCFQYFRTRNIKNIVQKTFDDTNTPLAIKHWNIISFVMATTLTRSISLDSRLHFVFFENQTDEVFLTSDQPIFNILGDIKDEKGNVKDLELFYPLTPDKALIVNFNGTKNNRYENAPIHEETVKWFNEKVIENSNSFIFSSSEEQLNGLIK